MRLKDEFYNSKLHKKEIISINNEERRNEISNQYFLRLKYLFQNRLLKAIGTIWIFIGATWVTHLQKEIYEDTYILINLT